MPVYTDATINAIKTRLTLSDVVKTYIPVIQKGGRQWAKCPFHGSGNERTESFTIDDQKGYYHCFACHESGDMFTFVQKMDHMTFPEAVEALALKAGVELEMELAGAKRDRSETEILYDLNNRLAGAFRYILLSSKDGAVARSYLEERKVSEEMSERFSLGYAPRDGFWLRRFLRSHGFTEETLDKSGLFTNRNKERSLFADRLMFPVRDRQGRVIAFSGRDLSGRPDSPKYVNSPDTAVYSKRHNFYGLYESLDALKEKNSHAVLVEGNFDVIAMHQAGLKTAVAALGTAFTEEQRDLLSRYVQRIDLMFDSDSAGQNSTDKAIALIHSKGLECNVHTLSSGKDASEIVAKEGEEALRNEFSSSLTAFDYLVNKEVKKYNIRTPKGKSDFVKAISSFLLATESGVERDSYILSLSTLLSVSEDTIREDISGYGKRTASHREETEDARIEERRFNRASITMDLFAMLYLANHRELFRQYRSRIGFGDLEDTEAQNLYIALENAMRNDVKSNELFLSFITDEKTKNDTATSFGLEEYSLGRISALDEVVDRISLRSMEKQRQVLTDQLRSFSDSLESEQIEESLRRKADLDRMITTLKGELFKRTAGED